MSFCLCFSVLGTINKYYNYIKQYFSLFVKFFIRIFLCIIYFLEGLLVYRNSYFSENYEHQEKKQIDCEF